MSAIIHYRSLDISGESCKSLQLCLEANLKITTCTPAKKLLDLAAFKEYNS